MKKNLLASYIAGILDDKHGESYRRIFQLFVPEFVIAFLIYFLPLWIDAYFIGCLKSTATYGTLGMTTNLLHFIMKIAEGISVGTVILSGFYNGKQEFENVGSSLRDAFWIPVITGFSFAGSFFMRARHGFVAGMCRTTCWHGGFVLAVARYRRLFMFISFAFIGFLRGIKNTRVPMQIYIAGVFTFHYCGLYSYFWSFRVP